MPHSLTDTECAQLRSRITRDGLEATAKQLELNTTTILRAACGLEVHSATRVVITERLNAEETR